MGPSRTHEVPAVSPAGAESGNLFAARAAVRRRRAIATAPELAAARVLCHQLRRKQARPDKQRIAHLICLNLLAILKPRAPENRR
jgi:hypothetical protein